jgi:hypothetical protein
VAKALQESRQALVAEPNLEILNIVDVRRDQSYSPPAESGVFGKDTAAKKTDLPAAAKTTPSPTSETQAQNVDETGFIFVKPPPNISRPQDVLPRRIGRDPPNGSSKAAPLMLTPAYRSYDGRTYCDLACIERNIKEARREELKTND